MAKRGRRKGDSGKKWTEEDLNFVKSSYMFLTDEEIGNILGRSRKTIHTIRRKNGWMKKDFNKRQDLCSKIPIVLIVPKSVEVADFLHHHKLSDIVEDYIK